MKRLNSAGRLGLIMLLVGLSTLARAAQPVAVVVDSNGKTVGPLIDASEGWVAVNLATGQAPVSFYIYQGTLHAIDFFVGYLTLDCTGTAYIEAQVPLKPGHNFYDPDTIWLPRQPIASTERVISSHYVDGKCRHDRYVMPDAISAYPTTITSLGFSPPYKVELK